MALGRGGSGGRNCGGGERGTAGLAAAAAAIIGECHATHHTHTHPRAVRARVRVSAAAAPAPASNVVSIAPEKAPWAEHEKPRVRMTELYQVMLKDLGKPEYDRLITKHGLGSGLMKHDSTEALACYREMEAKAREAKVAPQTESTTASDAPLF